MAPLSLGRLLRELRARAFLGIRIVLDALTLVFILLVGRGVSLVADQLFPVRHPGWLGAVEASTDYLAAVGFLILAGADLFHFLREELKH